MQQNTGIRISRAFGGLLLIISLAVLGGCGEAGTGGLSAEKLAFWKESSEEAVLEETPATKRRNVVFVMLESVRARSVTPYNPEVETTPFMDELAEESLLARRAYTTMPHTTKALVSADCGIDPYLKKEIRESRPDAIPVRCLADLLEEEGYRTAFFQPGGVDWEGRPQLVENFGYETLISLEDMDKEGFERANYFGYEDDIMLKPSRNWLESGDEPFFVTYKTLTPHHEYLAPERYGRVDFSEDDLKNRYLNSVRYVDFFVQNLFEQYKELSLYEDTIFVLYGDHGEGFGEHGEYQHDNTIWEEGLRVPLIFHDPQRFSGGRRVDELATLKDILPTVTDLLGYRIVGGEYTGASLLDLPENRTVMASCWFNETCVASIKGDEKYIHHYGERPDEFYDLSEDPLEQRNLAEDKAAETDRRLKELMKWRSENEALYGD